MKVARCRGSRCCHYLARRGTGAAASFRRAADLGEERRPRLVGQLEGVDAALVRGAILEEELEAVPDRREGDLGPRDLVLAHELHFGALVRGVEAIGRERAAIDHVELAD